jgi:hypothetical protein
MMEVINTALQIFPIEIVEEIFEVARIIIEEEIVNQVSGKNGRVETMVTERSLFTPTSVKVKATVLYGGQSRTALCIFDGDDTLYNLTTFRHIGGKKMVTMDHDFHGLEKFVSKLQQNHQTPIYIITTNPAGHFTCYTRQVDVQVQWTPNVRAVAACIDQQLLVKGSS